MSVTIVGLAVAALSWLLQHAGVQIDNETVSAWVFTTIQIIGAAIIYLGRVRHGDITWYGTTKQVPTK